MEFTLYVPDTGDIVQTTVSDAERAAITAQRLGVAVYPGRVDATKYYLPDGVLTPLPPPEPAPGPSPEEVLAAKRAAMSITPRQLFIAAARAGIITAEEAISGAAGGAMPAIVEAAIDTLSADDQLAARVTWARMQVVLRTDPMAVLLGAAAGMSAEQIDAFFEAAARI